VGSARATLRPACLLRDTRGATAIEYGLLAALIAVASIIAFQMLGLNLATIFTTIANALP
jgi:pilus assembly protein Flp/PilA